jgi:hypothetical protein
MSSFDTANDAYNDHFNLFLFAVCTIVVHKLIARILKLLEAQTDLTYEDATARKMAGFLTILMRLFHAKPGNSKIAGGLVAVGPHRTGLDGIVAATTMMQDKPPRFFVTTAFNAIPGMKAFLTMFEVIPVDFTKKKQGGQSANARALEEASKILQDKGCVVLFPQGDFAKLTQPTPPIIHAGIATLAVENNIPIEVLRLDGFWSLRNPLIPLGIRESRLYRAIGAMFHVNKIETTHCCTIDFHLKSENADLSKEDKIERIRAILYAYYEETADLKPEDIQSITRSITDGNHYLGKWRARAEQDQLERLNRQSKAVAGPALTPLPIVPSM